MPRDAGGSAEAILRVRKERLHSTMLIEILTLLVFLSIGYALVSRAEMAAQPMLDKIARLEQEIRLKNHEIRDLRVRVRGLEIANAQLAESLRRFAAQLHGTLPANDRVVVLPQDQFTAITTELANKTALLDEKQRDNSGLRAKLVAAGKGGTDLPNCTVAAGLLLAVDLEGDGSFTGHPLWAATAVDRVRDVPGLSALATGRNLSRAQFQALAQQVQSWGRAQSPQCGFRVKVKAMHSNLSKYLDQHRFVARFFYTAW
jgi:hypothetical protein